MPEATNIALWGPSGAGKTLYLTQLYRTEHPDWHVYIEAGSSEQSFANEIDHAIEDDPFMARAKASLRKNYFPEATANTGPGLPVRYIFEHRRSSRRARLYARDRAGVDWLNLDAQTVEQLKTATALILLFDAGSVGLEYEIQDVFEKLNKIRQVSGGEMKDPRPVALCLSKVDRHFATTADLERAKTMPTEFVYEKVSQHLAAWVHRFCANFQFLPVSSVGVKSRHGSLERLSFRDENGVNRIANYPEPVNLMKPIEWIFEQTMGSI